MKIALLILGLATSVLAQQQQFHRAIPQQNTIVGVWVFPDSLDIHEPVLHLHADGAFDMAQDGDELEKGQGAVLGTWKMASDTLALTVSNSICCQFKADQRLTLRLIQQKTDTLRVLFRGDTLSLASWKTYIAQWE